MTLGYNKYMRKIVIALSCLLTGSILFGQQGYKMLDSVRIDGQIFSAIVQNGDTLILARLDDVSLTSFRSFSSRDEYLRYLRYKKYAALVYPYAKDAVNVLKTVEDRTRSMSRSKRKKYVDHTYRQLEHNFKQQLKNLTKTQGKILVKMIEKEMDQSFYDIIKAKRNRFSAFYWYQFGKLYDYDLKRGYVRGDDYIMDAILKDFDLSNENGNPILLSK